VCVVCVVSVSGYVSVHGMLRVCVVVMLCVSYVVWGFIVLCVFFYSRFLNLYTKYKTRAYQQIASCMCCSCVCWGGVVCLSGAYMFGVWCVLCVVCMMCTVHVGVW